MPPATPTVGEVLMLCPAKSVLPSSTASTRKKGRCWSRERRPPLLASAGTGRCYGGGSPTAGAHHGRLRRRTEKRERRDGGSFPSPLRFLTTIALADAPSLQAAAFVDGNQGRSPLPSELTIGGRLALLDRRQLVARKAHCRSHAAAPPIVAAINRSSLAKGVRNSPS
nr:hypothetical protein Iba_chr04fCG11400 [Ipomoea batatas]